MKLLVLCDKVFDVFYERLDPFVTLLYLIEMVVANHTIEEACNEISVTFEDFNLPVQNFRSWTI